MHSDGAHFSDLDIYWKNAIDAGITGADITLSDVPSSCMHNSCAWEPYHTLAICSHVENVTDMLDFSGYNHAAEYWTYRPRIPLPTDHVVEGGSFFTQGTFFMAEDILLSDGRFRNQSTPNNTGTNLPDLAHIYLSYYDPCEATNDTAMMWDSFNKDFTPWRSYKAVFRLCIQALKSTYNASGMHTTIDHEVKPIKWTNTTTDLERYLGGITHWCANSTEIDEQLCLDQGLLQTIGGQLITSLNISAYWAPPGGDSYFFTENTPNIGLDVLGHDTSRCDPNYRGFKGWESRVNNIANSITNT